MKWLYVLAVVISGILQAQGNATSEHELGLVNYIVPLVINPTEDLEPPTFSAALFKKDELVGSGAIITKHYVLTLCSLLQTAEGTKIAPGDIKLVRPVFQGRKLKSIQNVTATNLEVHPECGGKTVHVGRDVALIHTKEPMDHVKYPKLLKENIPENKSRYMISNFRVHNHAASDTWTAIWYIITRRVDNAICEVLFKVDKEKFNAKENLCMSYFHLGDASYCKGDFGSPLSLRHKNVEFLAGLNLHKHKCGQPREAASFVSVKSNLDWIEKTMKR